MTESSASREEAKFGKVSRLNIRRASKSLTDIYVFFQDAQETTAFMREICFQTSWAISDVTDFTFACKANNRQYHRILFYQTDFCADFLTCD